MTKQTSRGYSLRLPEDTKILAEQYKQDKETTPQTIARLVDERCNGLVGDSEPQTFEDMEIQCFKYLKPHERQQIVKKAKLDSSELTAGEMIALVEKYTGVKRDEFIAQAIAMYGQRLLTMHLVKRDRASSKGVNANGETRGVSGAADDRIEKFFKQYVSDHGSTPTASKIAKAVGTHYNTAKRWLEINAH